MSAFKTPIVFINYRRNDSKSEARNLNNDLENAFGKGFVFRDIDDIRSGTIWIDKLKEAGSYAKVIIAVVGPNWLQLNDAGVSRLNDPKDWVRQELEQAIKDNKKIIPVLVKGGTLPSPTAIPATLHRLFDHQSFELRDDKWNLDLTALIKDISDLSGIKTIEDKLNEQEELSKVYKEKTTRKKIFLMSIGLLVLASLLIGYIVFNSKNKPFSSEAHSKPEEKGFCPEFENNAAITTLLYPFGEVNTNETQYELKIQDQISDICNKLSIFNDVKLPNIDQHQHFNKNQAKNKCKTCNSDIFITGLSGKASNGKANIKANIGFCDSKFTGYGLDTDKLEIVTSFSESNILEVDPNISQSLEYAFEIFLGIHQIKKGNVEEGIKIIQKAINKYPKSKDIEMAARKILWQAQFKMGRKIAAANTLEAIYNLDNRNTLPLMLKANIYFKEGQYDKAIEDLDIIIEKEPNKSTKDKFMERRGDSYFESKQFDKAKIDYENVSSNGAKAKIKATDLIIKNNNDRINGLGPVSNLSTLQKSELINLHVQNGNITQAFQILKTIDPSTYKTPEQMKAIGINVTTFNALQRSNQELPTAVRNNFNQIERVQLNKVVIENQ